MNKKSIKAQKRNLPLKTRDLQLHLANCMDDVDDKEWTPAKKKDSHDDADLV